MEVSNHVVLSKMRHGPTGSTYPLTFDVWVRYPEHFVFYTRPMDQQIEPWSAKGRKNASGYLTTPSFQAGWGPLSRLKVRPLDRKTIQKGSRHAVGPKARRIVLTINTAWAARCRYHYLLSGQELLLALAVRISTCISGGN